MIYYELGLTQEQSVSLILIQFLGNPDLVIYLLKMLRKTSTEDAQNFHCSLRRSLSDRWKKLDKSCKKQFKMNSSIPITCDLPFDGIRWRRSKEMMRHINYMFPGFIILKKDLMIENNEGINYRITNSLENYAVGIRGGPEAQEPNDIQIFNLYSKIWAINKIYKSFGGSGPIDRTITQVYRTFKIIVNCYESFDIGEWDQHHICELPYIEFNVSSGKTSLIYNEDELFDLNLY